MKNYCYFVQRRHFNDSIDEIGSKEILGCFTSMKEAIKRVEAEFIRLYPSEITESGLSVAHKFNVNGELRSWDGP